MQRNLIPVSSRRWCMALDLSTKTILILFCLLKVTAITVVTQCAGQTVKNVSNCALCRSRAEEVKNTANDTRSALDLSEEAIDKAKMALDEAHNNLNSTRNATAEVQHGNRVCLCEMIC